jgi:hypothetical protein
MPVTELLLAARARLTPPELADGQIAPLSLTEDGRLRVASKPGFFAASSDVFTAVGDVMAVDVTDASNVVYHVKNTGSVAMAAGAFAFEASLDSTNGVDGTWFSVQAARSNANTIETATGTLALGIGAGSLYSWEISVNAYRWVRIRCTTAITAGAVAMWTAIRGTYATEPAPAVPTHAVTGSGTFSTSPAAPTTTTVTGTASTNAALVTGSGATLLESTVFNPTAATIYVKYYNKSTAPVPASDSAVVVIPVPAGEARHISFGANGKRFATGLGRSIVGGSAANDATAVAAGVIVSESRF